MKRAVNRLIDWFTFPYSLLLLLKNSEISWAVKLKAGLILGLLLFYLLNPADLIPDCVPILGWLDDFAAVPTAMVVAEKIIPEISVTGLTQKARGDVKHILVWALAIVTAMLVISLFTFGLLIYLAIRFW
jgi:uncharacterized membrane protein YkvA (DUF1232 family)